MAVGYTDHIVGRVSSLVAVCTRRVSRATRRLLRHRLHYGVGAGAPLRHRKKQPGVAPQAPAAAVVDTAGSVQQQTAGGRDAGADDEGIWRREILMGERCQPLDFAGAIHYDSFGRRLAHPPTPRSASSLSCRSSGSLATSLENTEVLIQSSPATT